MHTLEWGHRFLMCAPHHFAVTYEINPWMRVGRPVDRERAVRQWQELVGTLEAAGATIERLDPVPGLPDLVFTANAGLIWGSTFVPSRFRDPERRPETPYDVGWFARGGWSIAPLPAGLVQEGAGDALPFGEVMVAGHGPRSSRTGAARAARVAGAVPLPVELVDDRLYHLDLAFCPLDSRRAMVVPDAFSPQSRRLLRRLVPEPLELDVDEALRFCANSVVIDRTVVMPHCPVRVGRQLEAWGFEPVVVDVGELEKAGGACRCLTLALDVGVAARSARAAA